MTMQDICCGHENKYPVVTERKLHHGNVILVGKFNKNKNICLSRCEGITDSKSSPDENISKALKVHNSTKQIVKSDCMKPLICTGPSVGSKIGKCMVGTGLPEVVIESQEAQPIQENCQTATVSITVQKDTQNDKLKPGLYKSKMDLIDTNQYQCTCMYCEIKEINGSGYSMKLTV